PDPGFAGLAVGHHALAGREDGHPEAPLDARQLGALRVDPEPRPADAAEAGDDPFLALPVPQGDADRLGWGLLHVVVRDEPLGLQDLRDLQLHPRRGHGDLGAPGLKRFPDSGQYIGDRIRVPAHVGYYTILTSARRTF